MTQEETRFLAETWFPAGQTFLQEWIDRLNLAQHGNQVRRLGRENICLAAQVFVMRELGQG